MINSFFNFLFKRFTYKEKLKFFTIAITSLLTNLIMLIIPLLQKKILDSIQFNKMDVHSIIMMCVLGIVSSLLLISEAFILNSLFIFLKNKIQRQLLQATTRKKIKLIDEKGAGAYMVSIFGDSDQIASLINTNYFSVIFLCITNIIILLISSKWSLVLIKVIVPTYILMILILYFSNKVYYKKFEKAKNIVYEVNPKVLEFIENKASILNYSNIQDYEEDIFNLFKKRDSYFKSAFAVNVFAKSFIDALRNLSMLVFFVLSINEILNKTLQISSFIAMISYFSRMFIPIFAIQELTNNMTRFSSLQNKIQDNLQLSPKLKLPQNNDYEFKECAFSYKDNIILNKFSLNLDKKIGIVGLSGEGKSTILKLMLGELEDYQGKCTYGKCDILDISKYIINSNTRVYSQDSEIFNNSLDFNITLGKIGLNKVDYENKITEVYSNTLSCFNNLKNYNNINNKDKEILKEIFLLSDDQILDKSILKQICNNILSIDDKFIFKLSSMMVSKKFYIKDKYFDLVNKLKINHLDNRDLGQRGKNISGGEKNKLCLARFLLSDYNGFFILDEPFVNVDLLSEKEGLEILKQDLKDLKGIIISHKINVIKDLSDEIIVLENGTIADRGTHEQLIERNGLYSKLYKESLILHKNM